MAKRVIVLPRGTASGADADESAADAEGAAPDTDEALAAELRQSTGLLVELQRGVQSKASRRANVVVAAPPGYHSPQWAQFGSYAEVAPDDFVSRVIAQCAVQPGLSHVYEEILLQVRRPPDHVQTALTLWLRRPPDGRPDALSIASRSPPERLPMTSEWPPSACRARATSCIRRASRATRASTARPSERPSVASRAPYPSGSFAAPMAPPWAHKTARPRQRPTRRCSHRPMISCASSDGRHALLDCHRFAESPP